MLGSERECMKKIILPLALVTIALTACYRNDLQIDYIPHVEYESTHPIFVMPDLFPDDYYERRDEFIRTAQKAESQIDFNFELQRFDTVLRDGHTRFFAS